MQVSIGRSHQPPVLCQAAWTVLLELLVCPPTRTPLQCKATLDRDISMHSIDGAFRPRGPRQGPHGATSSWPRMAGSWVNRESKTHKSKSCALCMLYVYFYKHSLSAMCGFVAVAVPCTGCGSTAAQDVARACAILCIEQDVATPHPVRARSCATHRI